jgi:hypothetical protein
MGSHVAGGIGVQHIFSFRNLAVCLALPKIWGISSPMVSDRQVVCTAMTSGFVYGEDIVNRLQQVRLASEHGGPFRKGTGGRHDRLLVVPGQRGPVIGVASLGAVAVGKTAVNPQRSIHGPDGLAGFGRIDGQRLAFSISLGVCRSNILLFTLSYSCQFP